MSILKILVKLTVILAATKALAHTTYIKKTEAETEYIIHYSDSEKWVVDSYRVLGYEYQDRTTQKVFHSYSASEQYVEEISNGFKELKGGKDFVDSKMPVNNTNSKIWNATNSWNDEWENLYVDWLSAEFTTDYFVRHNLATDCADAAYALRWIFARENSLPAAAQLAGSGALFTNDSMRRSWQNLSTHEDWWQDELFLAAINYVMNNTYTHTLNQDTFPIQIDLDHFTKGTVYLYLSGDSGHTRVLDSIGPGTVITMLSSTVPRAVRPLYEETFYADRQEENRGGLVKFRWIEKQNNYWRLRRKNLMPAFSLEQHDVDFIGDEDSYTRAIKVRLFPDLADLDYDEARGLTSDIRNELTSRIDVINQGYAVCSENHCEEGGEDYENWSTPSRDGRTRDKIQKIKRLVDNSEDGRVREHYNDVAESFSLDVLASLRLVWYDFMGLFLGHQYSTDPNDNPERRWGVLSYENLTIQTQNPYVDNTNAIWLIKIPAGEWAELHFDYIKLEEGYDYITIQHDGDDIYIDSEDSGERVVEVKSPGLVRMHFVTDESVTNEGFRISNIQLKEK